MAAVPQPAQFGTAAQGLRPATMAQDGAGSVSYMQQSAAYGPPALMQPAADAGMQQPYRVQVQPSLVSAAAPTPPPPAAEAGLISGARAAVSSLLQTLSGAVYGGSQTRPQVQPPTVSVAASQPYYNQGYDQDQMYNSMPQQHAAFYQPPYAAAMAQQPGVPGPSGVALQQASDFFGPPLPALAMASGVQQTHAAAAQPPGAGLAGVMTPQQVQAASLQQQQYSSNSANLMQSAQGGGMQQLQQSFGGMMQPGYGYSGMSLPGAPGMSAVQQAPASTARQLGSVALLQPSGAGAVSRTGFGVGADASMTQTGAAAEAQATAQGQAEVQLSAYKAEVASLTQQLEASEAQVKEDAEDNARMKALLVSTLQQANKAATEAWEAAARDMEAERQSTQALLQTLQRHAAAELAEAKSAVAEARAQAKVAPQNVAEATQAVVQQPQPSALQVAPPYRR